MRKLVFISVLASIMLLQGCGVIMSMRGAAFETQMTNTNPNMIGNPVKSNVFTEVQSLVVVDLTDGLTDYPKDNVLMYRAMVAELSSLLEDSGQFRVISPKKFRSELNKVNGAIDPQLTPEHEMDKIFQKVGKSIGAHAVVYAGLEEKGETTSVSNQLRYMGQVLKDGGITIDLEGSLKLVRSRELETLYEQKSDVAWASGTSGLENTSAAELRLMMRNLLKPMVDQMVEKHKG